MKIEDNRINEEMPFEDVSVGDCFIYDGEHYIKIAEHFSAPNAFNLGRNETDGFSTDVIVTLVKAKVVIE